MEEIFGTLLEQFGSLAWWYALAEVVSAWIGVILAVVMTIFVLYVFITQ